MPRLACEQAFGRAGNWGESWPTDHGQLFVGLYGEGLFPLLCSLPKPASNSDVSFSMKIFAPRKAGRRKRLSSFSFLWLAYVANASTRVSQAVPKLKPGGKKLLLSLSASFRAITRVDTLGTQAILWSLESRHQSLAFCARLCAKNESAPEEGGSPKTVP